LSYFGLGGRRDEISETVKPHYEDSNVRPDELVDYAISAGLGAKELINGDLETLKKLIAAGYPVMIERGFDELPDLEWMGHYMLMIGYSESNRELYALDAYWGAPSRRDGDADFPVDTWTYARIDELWRHFNRTYIIVYQPYQEEEVASIIGPNFDHSTMLANAHVTAQNEAALYDDTFAWYNLGSVLVKLGNYEQAVVAFDAARERVLPWRMYWYHFDLYEAYYQVGRYDDVLVLATFTSDAENYPESEEAYYYEGLVYAANDQTLAARNAFNKALSYNPTYQAAQIALANLDN
jgi:tetratricopeptide (TPR) repeat protein